MIVELVAVVGLSKKDDVDAKMVGMERVEAVSVFEVPVTTLVVSFLVAVGRTFDLLTDSIVNWEQRKEYDLVLDNWI